MRVIQNIFFFLAVACCSLGCDSETAGDCWQTAGEMVEVEMNLPEFTKIRLDADVRMTLQQGPQKVTVRAGKNLLPDVDVYVEDGRLVAQNNNFCNYVREYGTVEIIVSAPDINEIRNASKFEITSIGTLNYTSLQLLSDTSYEGGNKIRKSGDFFLDVDCDKIEVRANGSSLFKINGTVDDLQVRFFNESPRFEGADLIAEKVSVTHRSANKIIVNPQQSILGTLTGTGDVIAVNRPELVRVEQLYTGRLIFQE
ncbi:MAG: head GIN domain-containing protein [Leeuwenhoekiella sp.]